MKVLLVGVDVAKLSFDGALWLGEKGQSLGRFDNQPAGYERLAERLRRRAGQGLIRLIVEPTGGYEQPLVAFARQQGWQVCLPNPAQVRRWAQGIGRRAKNDKQDALLLAQYGSACQPKPQPALPAAVAELESLLARRQELEKMVRAERNRQEKLGYQPAASAAVGGSVRRLLESLEEELAAIEAAINELLAQNPALSSQAKKLRSVPGVGARTVLPLLVLLHRWHSLTDGQGSGKGLSAYLGLDPKVADSGQQVGRRAPISRMGNKSQRSRLYMAALGGTRGQNVLRHFYQRLVAAGKPKRLALVAAARKILVWAWSVFRQDTTFDPAYYERLAGRRA
jgi:transposase